MFGLPDEDNAEAAAASATHRLSAIHLGASQAFVNTAGLNKLRELDPLPAFDGTPAGWDLFAQDWHNPKSYTSLASRRPCTLGCSCVACRTASVKKVAGWVRDDPAMSLDEVFDRLRQDFQIADTYGDAHNWESLTLDAPNGKLTLAPWGT